MTVDEFLNIRYLIYSEFEYFSQEKNRFIETYKILNLEIQQEQKKEPKPKFDPNTLEVYDKVLVRDSDNQTWRAKFFHCKKGGEFYTIDDVIYHYCIPFNDETKHLNGTREDAPEFYQLD